ncbi:DUF6428 family protein [Flavobacterium sp.]|uniref:DUF6428 family protein n=1 Tax=Flavobacterium sp. TaxID=239 RepID=UPI0025EFF13F|nr:DUF6428 family protein [Flavobacterium sp.]
MKLSDIKIELKKQSTLAFKLPNCEMVPNHFHITEVGKVTKHFNDCGGEVRIEEAANFQLWEANDYDHRLHPEKLIDFIELSEKLLEMSNLEIEVEYQMKETIGKFSLYFDRTNFCLVPKITDCLANDKCGIAPALIESKIGAWKEKASCCAPNAGC